MTTQPVLAVTGASGGIGAAIALAAPKAGYRIAAGARRASRAEDILRRGSVGVDDHLVMTLDVTHPRSIAEFFDAAVDRFGRLDVVVANAGIDDGGGGIEHGDVEKWRAALLTNVGSAMTARAAIPALTKTKGAVVFIGSVAGRVVPAGSFYACTKWAVSALAEVREAGIRVSIVQPGRVDTDFHAVPRPGALEATDVAELVLGILQLPPHVAVNEIVVRPADQVQ